MGFGSNDGGGCGFEETICHDIETNTSILDVTTFIYDLEQGTCVFTRWRIGRTVMREIECAVSIAIQSFGSGGGIYVRSYHISLFQDKKIIY